MLLFPSLDTVRTVVYAIHDATIYVRDTLYCVQIMLPRSVPEIFLPKTSGAPGSCSLLYHTPS